MVDHRYARKLKAGISRYWYLAALAATLTGCATAAVAPPAAVPPPPAATQPPPPVPQPPLPEISRGLPPIPLALGPLEIRVVHPPENTIRLGVDSLFTFGSIGNGRATLTVNGTPVTVAQNGAFIAFVERPVNDTLRLVATLGDQVVELSRAYRPPPTGGVAVRAPATVTYSTPRPGVITSGSDTLATGSDAAIGRPTPAGTYRWFLPIGARVTMTGERADMVRVRLDRETEGWFLKSNVTAAAGAAPARRWTRPQLEPAAGWTDVRLAVGSAPFRIISSDSTILVTIHGMTAPADVMAGEDLVDSLQIIPAGADAVQLRIHSRRGVWGYKAFYAEDGALVVRVRRPPVIDPVDPLRGIRVTVDAGHPPGGAVGPTAFAEADANLGIALRLAERLRQAGAEVLMTRTAGDAVALGDRVNQATAWNADLLISVHNNAFPEGVNPFLRNGTSTYYFHGHSAFLARIMDEEIVATTLVRNLGPYSDNLALVRPTWMPSTLTESLFMSMPDHEAALRNPLFLDWLADAHVRGIARFLRERASRGLPRQN